MFEQWKEKELGLIRQQYGKIRLVTYVFMAILAFSLLTEVVLLLDGGGAMEVVVIVFDLVVMALIWYLGDYKRRFIKPLLASIEEDLPTPGEREEFARQMEGAVKLECPAAPQQRTCPTWLGSGYLYVRRPRKSQIVKTGSLGRARLSKVIYTVGRGHARTCYALELFQDGEKPAWSGVFYGEGEVYRALETVRASLPANLEVEDQIAYGKTEEGRRQERRSNLIQFILAMLVVAGMCLLLKLL